MLSLIGLADRAKEATKNFSGGMKRRLNIGIGLLHQPTLLILDEPTVGVDPQSRNAILESVEALSVEGMAVLYTTHYMEEAERLCDRIAIIDSGRLQAEGTRDELIRLTGGVDHIRIVGSGDTTAAAAALPHLDAVEHVATPDRSSLVLTVRDAPTAVATIVDLRQQQRDVAAGRRDQPPQPRVGLPASDGQGAEGLTMGQLLTMTASDLRQRIRDRSVIIFALVVPLALMYVFNLVFGGATDIELEPVTVAVAVPADDQLASRSSPRCSTQVDGLDVTVAGGARRPGPGSRRRR